MTTPLHAPPYRIVPVFTTLDPVCRMEIPPEEAVASATLDGWRRFHFCSLPCYEAFADLPHAYVGWAGTRRRDAAWWPLRSALGERPR